MSQGRRRVLRPEPGDPSSGFAFAISTHVAFTTELYQYKQVLPTNGHNLLQTPIRDCERWVCIQLAIHHSYTFATSLCSPRPLAVWTALYHLVPIMEENKQKLLMENWKTITQIRLTHFAVEQVTFEMIKDQILELSKDGFNCIVVEVNAEQGTLNSNYRPIGLYRKLIRLATTRMIEGMILGAMQKEEWEARVRQTRAEPQNQGTQALCHD